MIYIFFCRTNIFCLSYRTIFKKYNEQCFTRIIVKLTRYEKLARILFLNVFVIQSLFHFKTYYFDDIVM